MYCFFVFLNLLSPDVVTLEEEEEEEEEEGEKENIESQSSPAIRILSSWTMSRRRKEEITGLDSGNW